MVIIMKIGIDIDDTLTNTKEQQLIYWPIYISNNPQKGYTKKLPKSINEFGNEYIKIFWDTYRNKLSFNATFKKDASKILNKLQKEGHELCIITSRPDEKYQNLHQLLKDWFEKNNIPINTIYSNIKNKGLFCKNNNIDLLIDDSIKHCKDCQSYNIKSILFARNNKYKGLKTTNWNKVYKIIKDIQNNK